MYYECYTITSEGKSYIFWNILFTPEKGSIIRAAPFEIVKNILDLICFFIFCPNVEVVWKCPWEIGVLTFFFFNRPSCIFCNSCKSICQIHFPDPSVLKLWLRVAKIGALISFTHKTSVWSQWESEQNAMEDGGLWSKVWVSNPIPYLPSLKEGQDNNTEPCQEMAKVYIYKKLWSYKYMLLSV